MLLLQNIDLIRRLLNPYKLNPNFSHEFFSSRIIIFEKLRFIAIKPVVSKQAEKVVIAQMGGDMQQAVAATRQLESKRCTQTATIAQHLRGLLRLSLWEYLQIELIGRLGVFICLFYSGYLQAKRNENGLLFV